MPSVLSVKRPQKAGVALIMVLAFVVLLSGLVVAYLFRSSVDRQSAESGFEHGNADMLARSAMDIIVGDFKQEIVNGSQPLAFGRYTPLTNDNVVPKRSGNPAFATPSTDPIPNLIRRSVTSDTISAPGVSSRASAVNSTTDVSANGRSISLDRWNTHYLLPRHDPSSETGSTPMSPVAAPYGPGDATGFTAPDWVIVTRDGPTPFASWNPALADARATNGGYALGRYAYAVYDEGGLLDMNVAGYPTNVGPSVTDIGRKGIVAFADLTTLPTSPGNTMSATAINKFVLFRNYATTQSTSTLGAATTFNPLGTQAFVNYFLGNPQIGINQDFRTVRATPPSGGRTDQHFISRAELISFRQSTGIAHLNTLQYLGTFSRERNASTWRTGAGATTVAIESALAQRFYIGTLDVVRPGAAGLQNVMGLTWQAGSPNGSWVYKGPSNATAIDHIPALSAAQHDFFAILNYGLNGVSGDDFANIQSTLAVGASIIDEYDAAGIADPTSGSTTTIIQSAAGNVYGYENTDPARPTPAPTPLTGNPNPIVINRAFRNVGEFGYGIKTNVPALPTVDLFRIGSTDAPILDLFTYNLAPMRSGIVGLNTRQPPVLAAILRRAITTEAASTIVSGANTNNDARNAANAIVDATGAAGGAALSRADIVRLTSFVTTTPFTAAASEEIRETVARALAETTQTRAWGLLIDVVAQTGNYAPNATNLSDFIVKGEKRYWLHVAIDRFTGEVIDQQLEAVYE